MRIVLEWSGIRSAITHACQSALPQCHIRFLCQEHKVVPTSLERWGREGEGQPKEKEKRTSAFVNEQWGDDNSHCMRARRTLGFIAEPGNRCPNGQWTSTFVNGKQDDYRSHCTSVRRAPSLIKQGKGQLGETGRASTLEWCKAPLQMITWLRW